MTRPRCASTVTANLLAEVVAVDVFKADELRNAFAGAHRREIEARIFEHTKRTVGIHVYLTDSKGVVVFDSDGGRREGEDYATKRDVARTLAGKYGARSSRDRENDSTTSVLYVAAPVGNPAKPDGVLTVYKAQADVLPLVRERQRIIYTACGMIGGGILFLIGAVFLWLFHPIGKITEYARAIDQARPLAEVAGVQLADRAEASPVLLRGDSFILRAAVTNLLENAIDFSPRGGAVDIDVESSGGNVVLSVRDHGPGVPDYAREKIFERFYSLRHLSSRTPSTQTV
jgi:two-component system sensor histidine kinase CreC